MVKMNIFPIDLMSWKTTTKKTIVFLSIFCVLCVCSSSLIFIGFLHCIKWSIINSEMEHFQEDLNCLNSNNRTVVYLNLEECNAGSFIGRMVNFPRYKWCVVKFILFLSFFYIYSPRYFVEFGFVSVINIFRGISILNGKKGTRKRIDLGLIKYEYT